MRTISRTGFDFSFLRLFSKNLLPGKLHCTFFTRKVSTVILIEEVYALSRSKNDKGSSIPRYDILTKIRRIMTTALTFSRQNDAGSRASTTWY